MQILSRKLARAFPNHPTHYCPGCKSLHTFAVDRPFDNGARWTWDGCIDAPTFSPSMNVGPGWCHYFLHNGQIEFLSDCKHELAGKTVPLPDLPDWALKFMRDDNDD